MTLSELAVAADRVNTGMSNPDTSRALVVFNLTDHALSGTAVFRASMSWPLDTPLPPVLVSPLGAAAVPASIQGMTFGPDAKGRPDRHQLSLSLCFQVSDVPANGWRTYIAAYADVPSPSRLDCIETPGLFVVETTRHGGDLPPVGNF